MNALLIRVGIDQAYGGWNAPVHPITNRFFYLPIPERTGTAFHPNLERQYQEFTTPLKSYCESCGNTVPDIHFPQALFDRSVHLDPDFAELTYGDDGSKRGAEVKKLHDGDLLVFYAGMKPVLSCEHRLLYALIGLYVVDEVLEVHQVPQDRWHENAHTRKLKHGATDIVARAKRGLSGRLERCIPIGEWRDRAYRVRNDLLQAWGGLSVKDGYIQRSAVPPRFESPKCFYKWFKRQSVPFIERNN